MHYRNADPLAASDGTIDFDFDEVERRVAGECGPLADDGQEQTAELLQRLSGLAEWLADGRSGQSMATRTAAFCWLMERFPGESQSAVAAKLGLNNRLVSRAVRELCMAFPLLRNRFQSHGRPSGSSQVKTLRFPAGTRPERN